MSESPYDAAFDEEPVEQEYPNIEPEEEPLDDDEMSLLYNGHLTGEVKLGSRHIRLRTLTIGEELEAALLAAPWKDTADANRALVTAYVAASVTTVDGEQLVTVLGPNDKELEMKFDHILSNWYWQPTVSAVYDEYNDLLRRVNEASDKVKKG